MIKLKKSKGFFDIPVDNLFAEPAVGKLPFLLITTFGFEFDHAIFTKFS